jgi:hypothetical protein
MLKIPFLSQYKRHTTIKPCKIEKLFPPKSPFSCLTHPMGWFWSIFFNETFRISYSHLVEWIRTLGSGIQTIGKNHNFLGRTPYLNLALQTAQCPVRWAAFIAKIQ